MPNQTTWLSGDELAEIFQIRPSRLAQMMRAGLIDYVTSIGGPLIHREAAKKCLRAMPELIEVFRVEREVDFAVEEGGIAWEPQTYQRPSTVRLLECVKRHEGSFPSKPPPPRNRVFRQSSRP